MKIDMEKIVKIRVAMNTPRDDLKLSDKQFTVYYYFLSISKFNQYEENHST